MRYCIVCGIDISDKKASAKTCSPKCRKLAFSKRSIGTETSGNGTEKVVVVERKLQPEIYFKFYTISKANGMGRSDDEKSAIRTAKYWYDVPLGAVPVIQKDWPEVPDYMNGRQYFLWWKNEFEVKDGKPVILNPYPAHDKLEYVNAGEGSSRWGV